MKLTFICRFIVMQNNVMKYMTRIGQNTGMLKKSKNVHTKAMTVAFVAEYQNLNSGSLNSKKKFHLTYSAFLYCKRTFMLRLDIFGVILTFLRMDGTHRFVSLAMPCLHLLLLLRPLQIPPQPDRSNVEQKLRTKIITSFRLHILDFLINNVLLSFQQYTYLWC